MFKYSVQIQGSKIIFQSFDGKKHIELLNPSLIFSYHHNEVALRLLLEEILDDEVSRDFVYHIQNLVQQELLK
jgi:hypothetical protein